MDTSILLPKLDLIEPRGKLFYNTYKYRAKFKLSGAQHLFGVKSMLSYLKRLDSVYSLDFVTHNYFQQLQVEEAQERCSKQLAKIDLDAIERYIEWRNCNIHTKKIALARIESETVSVFSNDLVLLNTLESITKPIEYSSIDDSIPVDTIYFSNKPKHNYRVYFKSKRVTEKARDDLISFINRYKNTSTQIVPSDALGKWLNKNNKFAWRGVYLYGNYFLDFDEESTYSLIALMCGDLISSKYKLEQHPNK